MKEEKQTHPSDDTSLSQLIPFETTIDGSAIVPTGKSIPSDFTKLFSLATGRTGIQDSKTVVNKSALGPSIRAAYIQKLKKVSCLKKDKSFSTLLNSAEKLINEVETFCDQAKQELKHSEDKHSWENTLCDDSKKKLEYYLSDIKQMLKALENFQFLGSDFIIKNYANILDHASCQGTYADSQDHNAAIKEITDQVEKLQQNITEIRKRYEASFRKSIELENELAEAKKRESVSSSEEIKQPSKPAEENQSAVADASKPAAANNEENKVTVAEEAKQPSNAAEAAQKLVEIETKLAQLKQEIQNLSNQEQSLISQKVEFEIKLNEMQKKKPHQEHEDIGSLKKWFDIHYENKIALLKMHQKSLRALKNENERRIERQKKAIQHMERSQSIYPLAIVDFQLNYLSILLKDFEKKSLSSDLYQSVYTLKNQLHKDVSQVYDAFVARIAKLKTIKQTFVDSTVRPQFKQCIARFDTLEKQKTRLASMSTGLQTSSQAPMPLTLESPDETAKYKATLEEEIKTAQDKENEASAAHQNIEKNLNSVSAELKQKEKQKTALQKEYEDAQKEKTQADARLKELAASKVSLETLEDEKKALEDAEAKNLKEEKLIAAEIGKVTTELEKFSTSPETDLTKAQKEANESSKKTYEDLLNKKQTELTDIRSKKTTRYQKLVFIRQTITQLTKTEEADKELSQKPTEVFQRLQACKTEVARLQAQVADLKKTGQSSKNAFEEAKGRRTKLQAEKDKKLAVYAISSKYSRLHQAVEAYLNMMSSPHINSQSWQNILLNSIKEAENALLIDSKELQKRFEKQETEFDRATHKLFYEPFSDLKESIEESFKSLGAVFADERSDSEDLTIKIKNIVKERLERHINPEIEALNKPYLDTVSAEEKERLEKVIDTIDSETASQIRQQYKLEKEIIRKFLEKFKITRERLEEKNSEMLLVDFESNDCLLSNCVIISDALKRQIKNLFQTLSGLQKQKRTLQSMPEMFSKTDKKRYRVGSANFFFCSTPVCTHTHQSEDKNAKQILFPKDFFDAALGISLAFCDVAAKYLDCKKQKACEFDKTLSGLSEEAASKELGDEKSITDLHKKIDGHITELKKHCEKEFEEINSMRSSLEQVRTNFNGLCSALDHVSLHATQLIEQFSMTHSLEEASDLKEEINRLSEDISYFTSIADKKALDQAYSWEILNSSHKTNSGASSIGELLHRRMKIKKLQNQCNVLIFKNRNLLNVLNLWAVKLESLNLSELDDYLTKIDNAKKTVEANLRALEPKSITVTLPVLETTRAQKFIDDKKQLALVSREEAVRYLWAKKLAGQSFDSSDMKLVKKHNAGIILKEKSETTQLLQAPESLLDSRTVTVTFPSLKEQMDELCAGNKRQISFYLRGEALLYLLNKTIGKLRANRPEEKIDINKLKECIIADYKWYCEFMPAIDRETAPKEILSAYDENFEALKKAHEKISHLENIARLQTGEMCTGPGSSQHDSECSFYPRYKSPETMFIKSAQKITPDDEAKMWMLAALASASREHDEQQKIYREKMMQTLKEKERLLDDQRRKARDSHRNEIQTEQKTFDQMASKDYRSNVLAKIYSFWAACGQTQKRHHTTKKEEASKSALLLQCIQKNDGVVRMLESAGIAPGSPSQLALVQHRQITHTPFPGNCFTYKKKELIDVK